MSTPPELRTRSSNPVSPWVRLVAWSLALLTAAGAEAATAAATPSREYEIKAAFLYNFTKFVEWPAASFPDATAPIVIGVLGDSPFAAALERVVHDRTVNGRAIAVRRVESLEELATAHVLFVASTEEARFGSLEPTIETSPILTVGESEFFASLGGVVTFVVQDDKVRFEVNASSADHAGLKISAQLLKLATTVRRSRRWAY
jgi:hypothetical protein